MRKAFSIITFCTVLMFVLSGCKDSPTNSAVVVPQEDCDSRVDRTSIRDIYNCIKKFEKEDEAGSHE